MYVKNVTTAACGLRAREILSRKAVGSQICLLTGRGCGDQQLVLHMGWKPRGGCRCGTGSQNQAAKGTGKVGDRSGSCGESPGALG